MVIAAPELARFEGVLIKHDEDLTQLKRTISQRIAKRLADLNITQAELQLRTGIDQAQLSRYVTSISAPTIPTIIKLARALDCTADYLIGRDNEPNPPKPLEPDPSSGLNDDEWTFLEEYRRRRLALQGTMFKERQALNDLISTFPDESRYEMIVFLAELMQKRGGKFDNLPNKK